MGKINKNPVLEDRIMKMIVLVRGEKVLLDRDISVLYNVETRALKQAVKRNKKRFPSDFMLELNNKEIDLMVSQNVIPSRQYLGGSKPFVFTEQGVAMLSSILRSDEAIAVNIAIMRAFVNLRTLVESNRALAKKINQLEKKYDKQFEQVFIAIKQLMAEDDDPKKKIGYL